MMIRNMFAEDINRQINGVIKVDQDTTDVIEQEVREYVITKELKKHFISFFRKLQKRNYRKYGQDGRVDFRLLWKW